MVKKKIEFIIFNIKWVLIFFYIKLLWTLIKLLYQFYVNPHLSTEDTMPALEDLDIVMIANLIKMGITGSYNSFVSKHHEYTNENISSGTLKIKIGTSIIGVSSIHLLQVFVNSDKYTLPQIEIKILINLTFIVSAYVLAKVNDLQVKSEATELEIDIKEQELKK
jgi:uncharacterized protein (TIGR00645 family)